MSVNFTSGGMFPIIINWTITLCWWATFMCWKGNTLSLADVILGLFCDNKDPSGFHYCFCFLHVLQMFPISKDQQCHRCLIVNIMCWWNEIPDINCIVVGNPILFIFYYSGLCKYCSIFFIFSVTIKYLFCETPFIDNSNPLTWSNSFSEVWFSALAEENWRRMWLVSDILQSLIMQLKPHVRKFGHTLRINRSPNQALLSVL